MIKAKCYCLIVRLDTKLFILSALYPRHTSTLMRLESDVTNMSLVYHGIVHTVSGADSG